MYRTILFISVLVSLATTACQASGVASEMTVEVQMDLSDLPADLVVAETLPSSIHDPLLMKGWIALYNQQDSIELGDGQTFSGQQLAQYVIDHGVEITWSSNENYAGSGTDRGGTDIVYITPDIQTQVDGQMTRLVSALANELFHHTQPFNQTKATLYEEYWAFYVGAYVSGNGQAAFYYTNPLNLSSLQSWFENNNRGGYLDGYEAYPASIPVLT